MEAGASPSGPSVGAVRVGRGPGEADRRLAWALRAAESEGFRVQGLPVEGSRVRGGSVSEGFHVPGVLCLSGFSDQRVLVSEGVLCRRGESWAPGGSVSEAVPASEASWVPATGGNGSGAHRLPGLPAAAAPALLPAERRHPSPVPLDGSPGLPDPAHPAATRRLESSCGSSLSPPTLPPPRSAS